MKSGRETIKSRHERGTNLREDKTMKKLILILAAAALATTSTLPLVAADNKPAEKKEAPAKEAGPRSLPYSGKIVAVDKTAKTIKVRERTFHVTSDTKINKAGKPATLDDAAVGEEVGISYREDADKKLNLVSLRIGAKPDAAPKKEAPAK